ncbi:hypothetical protein IIA79_06690 [bacterium]|nr:hypothetical protein [bacterium]
MTSPRRITREELAKGDGKDGRPALVAYRGNVYDVTESLLWRDGVHLLQHQAGQDLTNEMGPAPHDDEVMEGFEVVGVLIEDTAEMAGLRTPPWIAAILAFHPHPIAAHFPIALASVASLLVFASLFVTGEPLFRTLRTVALYNLVISAVATPVGIATGLLSWYYSYAAVWSYLFQMKTYLSILLVLLSSAALIIRFTALDGSEVSGNWYWAYTVLVLLHAPTVFGLGYFGGKITFP